MPEYVPEVTRVEVAGRKLRLTSLDKVMYPSTETTKGEVLAYYAQVAPLLLPHIADRPVTRVRWPHGVEDQMFFEKNLPSGAPSWLPRVPVDDVTYPLIPTSPTSPTWSTSTASRCTCRSGPSTTTASGATPTGWSSTSTPASRPVCTSAPRSPCSCATGSRPSVSRCSR